MKSWTMLPTSQSRQAASGFLHPHERVVLFNTGSGLKYSNLVQGEFPIMDPADTAAIDAL